MKLCVSVLALCIAFVATMIPNPVSATTVTFQDGDFPNANWSVTTEILNGGGTVTGVQVASGGTPGAFRRIDNTTNSAIGTGVSNSVYGFHRLVGATLNPSVSGAILSIDYSEDSQRISGGVQACGVALRQGGVIYYGPGFLNPITFGVWAATTQSGLVASQFDAIAPGLQTPNFTSTGTTIEFGFSRANSTSVGGGGSTTVGGIDNWKVTVSVDSPVATKHSTWGKMKALYRAE